MIVDTSAIVAYFNAEPEADAVEEVLAAARALKIGAPTRLETSIVLELRFGVKGKTFLARMIQEFEIETIEFNAVHADIAVDAYRRFGKGRHPAKLNMGDCFSYATAAVAREPLLCIGNDFPRTDLELVDLRN